MGKSMRTNFVLVDFENVQPKRMSLLNGGPFKVKVKIFLGASQTKLSSAIVREMQPFGADAEYIQIDGNGSNALDFHIAYYIGRLAVEHPDACFHVISKDTGFDPLIRHLRTQRVCCQRSTSVNDVPWIKISNANTVSEKVNAVIENLNKRKSGRPRTAKTLHSTIKALFVNQLSVSEVDALQNELIKLGVVKLSEGRVSYHFADQGSAE